MNTMKRCIAWFYIAGYGICWVLLILPIQELWEWINEWRWLGRLNEKMEKWAGL